MKIRTLLLAGLVSVSLTALAQTHKEGVEYYKADQLTNAQELLNRNLNNPGTDKSLSYYYLGQIEMYQNNVKEATKYFNDGITANPENPYNYVGLGYIALKNGDVKGAEKYFKEAEGKAKKDQSVNVDIARAYYNVDRIGNQQKYEKRIENVLKKDKENTDAYIFQGDVLRDEAYQTGDSKIYGAAAAKYDMAKNYNPTSAVAYVKYADMYMNANNPNMAITQLEELLRNNPSSALGQRELANAYYTNQNYGKAAEKYGQYVENPNHFKEDEDRYSFILFYDGKYQKGYDYATQLLNADPKNFSARRYQFMNAAQIESMESQLLPMADALLREHKANLANKFAPIDYTLIADEFTRNKRQDDAVALLEEAMREIPGNNNFVKQLATIYIDKSDYAKAADTYEGYVKNLANPGYVDFVQEARYAYYGGIDMGSDKKDENGNVIRPANAAAAQTYYNKAIEYANKAKEANSIQYLPSKILGDVAIQLGNPANGFYEEAIALIDANPDPRFNNDAASMYKYLTTFYANNDNAKAKTYANKYLEINPNDSAMREIAKSLK